MSERDFQIGGRNFKLSKLDTFKQFHIARRLGPLLADLLPAMKSLRSMNLTMKDLNEAEKFDEAAKVVGPLMIGLSKLTDADADLVLFGLLSSVEMQQAQGNWARLATNSMLMIQDLELPVMLQIAGRAFVFNLQGFFGAPPAQ